MAWIIENIGSILVGAMLLGLVALLIVGSIKGKKKGKGGCGCGCSECSMKEICHKENNTENE